MTSIHSTTTSNTGDCARFEAQLGAWLETDLEAADQAWMLRHRESCAECAAMVTELEQVVADAAALPPLSPPTDLWSGIEARLHTPVIAIGGNTTATTTRAPRAVSMRWFAVAATMLVTVSSAITWQFATRSRGAVAAPATTVAAGNAAARTGDSITTDNARALADDSLAAPTAQIVVASASTRPAPRDRNVSRTASDDFDDTDVTYEREITALRRIVDERFAELDTGTVRELRRNLAIIDRAIRDSRTALTRDPRSAMLSTQLDRALQAKLELLRKVALL
jgi:hypothetical protein